ncbi:MAG: hypothetical protein U0931_30005 [Vulcanimicrobiota bacterium]
MGLGLFFVSSALLMLELVLTRIFSVTHWSHFACLAISVAMFGTTLASLTVYLWPARFPRHNMPGQLALIASLFAVSNVVCFPAQLFFAVDLDQPLLQALSTALFYLMVSMPFYWGGLSICLVLTRGPGQVNRMYACDLMGAALGCLLAVLTLSLVSAETAVLASGLLGALGALSFAQAGSSRKATTSALAILAGLLTLAIYNEKTGLITISYVKGAPEGHHDLVRWNAYSRVTLDEDRKATGWGLSPIYPRADAGHQRWLEIDAAGSTPVIAFDGNLKKVDFLAYDVTALPFYLRPGRSVAVIGSGGGKDLLTALLFGCPRPVGVEINEIIVDLLNGELREYSGELVERCRIVADEGRSWLARQREHFAVILISLVDNNAAFASGAYPISENNLYSRQAWRLILERLEQDGVFAVTLPFRPDYPVEILRAANLARAALLDLGETRADQCFLAARIPYVYGSQSAQGQSLATVLISRRPFSKPDIETLRKVAKSLQFHVIYAPGPGAEGLIQSLLRPDNQALVDTYPYDLDPPTDDKPYFFFTLKPGAKAPAGEVAASNTKALSTLFGLLGVTTTLALLCIGGPLMRRAPLPAGTRARLVYFGALGFGYITVEMSQLQRMSSFLGRPVYSISLVLFTFLLFSGLGSALSAHIPRRSRPSVLIALLVVLVATYFGQAALLPKLVAQEMGVRILWTCLILAPAALLMGFPFPMALTGEATAPWFYGVNGIASILASISANLLALFWGVKASAAVGLLCYGVALVASLRLGSEQTVD